jgi:hypothetical protein
MVELVDIIPLRQTGLQRSSTFMSEHDGKKAVHRERAVAEASSVAEATTEGRGGKRRRIRFIAITLVATVVFFCFWQLSSPGRLPSGLSMFAVSMGFTLVGAVLNFFYWVQRARQAREVALSQLEEKQAVHAPSFATIVMDALTAIYLGCLVAALMSAL